MERFPPKPMTPLDELVTPPFLYTLKLLLPYVPVSAQRMLAIFLKFFELKKTMEIFYGFDGGRKEMSPDTILNDLKPYMNPEEQEMMEQMEGMKNMMDMMQQMQQTTDDSNTPAGHTDGDFAPFDFLKGMLDPEQQSMFDTYNHIFSSAVDSADSNAKKGENDYE